MLVGRLAFIDTSAYEAKNFQFSLYQLQKLKQFCDKDKLRILITTITVNEIKKHLKRKSVETAKLLKNAKSDLRFLRNIPSCKSYGIFEEAIDEDFIYSCVLADFEKFMQGKNIELVPLDNISIDDVFERYFSQIAPFSEGKKNEFPDAFALEAIRKISRERHYPVYVVSQDKDMASCCDNVELHYLERVDELIDLLNRNEEELKVPLQLVDLVFEDLSHEIKQYIDDYIFRCNVSINGLYNVEDIEIIDFTYGVISKDIVDIYVDDDSSIDVSMYVNINLKITLQVEEVNYDDSIFDKEEGKYLFLKKDVMIMKFEAAFDIPIMLRIGEGVRKRAEVLYMDTGEEELVLQSCNGYIVSSRN